MRRPRWCRALVAIWGLWFTAVLSDPGGLHSCPMHGDHAAQASHGAMDASGPHATPASTDTDDAQHHSNACTCLGLCCCGTTVASPARAHEVFVATLVDVPAREYLDVARPIVARAYAHPFANGPPATA